MKNVYIVVWTGNGRIYHPKGCDNATFYTSREIAQSVCYDLNDVGIFRKILNYTVSTEWSVRKLSDPYKRDMP